MSVVDKVPQPEKGAIATPGPRFLISAGVGPAQRKAATVRAFLWLKRRVEELGENGVLVVGGEEELRGRLREDLGAPLMQVLVQETRLYVDYDRFITWSTADALPPVGSTPLAFLERAKPDRGLLDTWPAPVLVLTATRSAMELVQEFGALEPSPEDYTRAAAGPPRASLTDYFRTRTS
jgi:hypothetical protein